MANNGFWDRFKSRKFLLTLGGIFTAVGGALEGVIDWSTAISSIVTLIMAYLGVEGMSDLVERYNTTKKK